MGCCSSERKKAPAQANGVVTMPLRFVFHSSMALATLAEPRTETPKVSVSLRVRQV